ncbi:MAG: amidohydrolase/deacetylase family metallohydrolase [Bryobacterales bacterium]|nr:amidohydrolase/deacetylase family metallohydrolase [Bryobacteraceae bacterium]MDW8355636.1 amidohydrolase/deacetylase family metallohydrolase [Bryobacterales bacterium]
MKLVVVLIAASWLLAQADYDLLLKGGQVIDPKNRVNARRDVAIKDGRIAEVAADIPPARAHKVVDVSGLFVTPGLVDIHVHVFAGEGPAYTGRNSVFPDDHSFRSGVTTVVDAGSSGWKNFADFKRRVVDRSRTRVLALLNIVGAGMAGPPEQDTSDMDPKATAEQILRHRDILVGVKTAHYQAPDWIAVERAVEAGRLANVPVMVDFGAFRPERPFQDLVLKKLRPGDIYTHAYLAWVPMLDDNGRVQPYLFEARKRGIIFDVGHGGGSFVFRHAVPAVRQGFFPDSISTDLHIGSMNAGMKDMLNVMSKFLNMGMSLEEVILRSTWNPARFIRREELGHLTVGAVADVAVLRLLKGDFGFVDVYGARLRGTQKLAAELTVKDGLVVWDLNGITRQDWDKLGQYGPQGDARWDGTIGHAGRQRK